MFDVTNFLMRWLFLCNLFRDVADIQTLPYHPNNQQQQIPQNEQPPDLVGTVATSQQTIGRGQEGEWRDGCLRSIMSCPPGNQRILMMDAMRAELVKRLSTALHQADVTLRQYEASRKVSGSTIIQQGESRAPSSTVHESSESATTLANHCDSADKSYLNSDVEIVRTFQEETARVQQPVLQDMAHSETSEQKARMGLKSLLSRRGKRKEIDSMVTPPSADEVEDARRTVRTVRDYLPQLVSVVLKSPPAFESRLLDPVDKLRRLIIRRCVEDANWGVDMCWLLEAEVGRTWKSMFEHRQQTGRRLIVVMPADKAAVIAKIGTERREAFDLLQDSEQATAYGYTLSMDQINKIDPSQMIPHPAIPHNFEEHDRPSARLPSSISLRRCSHFGDTMHFIDRLTKISLDMKRIPVSFRHQFLQDNLREMNRRLRRRMVTRGDVSLDVEDDRGPDDWPLISDISAEMVHYSVHLPLDPKQQNRWPGGDNECDLLDGGAVRVLNIVVEECRTLSSRERCPFLVHVEVAETGLNSNDSRLYASGAPGLGATVEEALAMNEHPIQSNSAVTSQDYASYQIPEELLSPPLNHPDLAKKMPEAASASSLEKTTDAVSTRGGGWYSNETPYYPESSSDLLSSNPYDSVPQDQIEQLHNQWQEEQDMVIRPPTMSTPNVVVSTGAALLDLVFGQPWAHKCEEIRQSSPFGKTDGWRLASFIMKAGEDIRRESLVMQVIANLNDWFQELPESVRPRMRPYMIMSVGGDAGLVECLSDAKTIDEVKKRMDGFRSLRDYFIRAYGLPSTRTNNATPQSSGQSHLTFEEAQDNFLRSLVGYSLVCYILQIKDRHNANILIDREGHIVHIDFGFVLGDTSKMGKVPMFSERAPFKLSAEFWDVLGGWNTKQGGLGVKFCKMFEEAFSCASSHVEEMVSLVEATLLTLTQSSRQARLLADGVRNRLRMRGGPGSREQKAFIMELVNAALTSLDTTIYDWLQKNMNGYQ